MAVPHFRVRGNAGRQFYFTERIESAIYTELTKLPPMIGVAVRAAMQQFLAANNIAQGATHIIVDGVPDAREENVSIPGVIQYVIPASTKAEAVLFALGQCVARSPRGTGSKDPGVLHYAENWLVFVNGVPWPRPISEIPPREEVGIVNVSDYARKIDVGGMRMSVPPGIIETVRQLTQRKFPALEVERIFVTIPGGYVLKGRSFRSGLSYDKKIGFFQSMPRRQTGRADSRRGQVMTYPSLIINER